MLSSLIFYWQKKGRVAFCFEMQQSLSASLSMAPIPEIWRQVRQGQGCGWGTCCWQSLLLSYSKTMGDDGWWRSVANEEKVGLKAQPPDGKWSWGGLGWKCTVQVQHLTLADSKSLSPAEVAWSSSKSRLIIWELKRFFDTGQMQLGETAAQRCPAWAMLH